MNPTLSWEKVGSKFYRTFQGLALRWAVRLEESCIASAPNGGAIAVWDRYSAIRALSGAQPRLRRVQLSVYSGSGELIGTLPWDQGELCSVGWTADEKLVAVSAAGVVRVFTDFNGRFEQLKLPLPALSVQFHANGAVVESEESLASITVTPDGLVLSECAKPAGGIDCWCISCSYQGRSQEILILAATPASASQAAKLLSLSFDGRVVPQNLPLSSTEVGFQSLVMSQDNHLVAVHLDNHMVYVYTRSFDQLVAQTSEPLEGSRPIWVGTDALIFPKGADLGHIKESTKTPPTDEAIMLDLASGAQSLQLYDLPVVFTSEVDGVRLFTSHTHDFCSAIPQGSADIYRIGSSSPSAILYSSVELLADNPAKAHESLSLIARDQIATAVTQCCNAAVLEMDVKCQKRLLRAAALGKSSSPLSDSSAYLWTLERLRILNNLREGDVGMLITSIQLDRLGFRQLINRLQNRKLYKLAYACCTQLKLPTEPLYAAWAISKIKECVELNDEELLALLDGKLATLKGTPFAAIGKRAFIDGRPGLAITLASREQDVKAKVELLLLMKKYDEALQAGARSGDVELVSTIMVSMRKTLSLPHLYRCFNDDPLLINCYVDLLRAESANESEAMQKVHEFYYHLDLKVEDLYARTKFAYTKDLVTDETILELSAAQKGFSEIKDGAFNARVLSDNIKLVQLQQKLESEYSQSFTGLSVVGTISELLQISQTHRANNVRQSFKISDQQWVCLRVKTLAAKRDWNALWDFSQEVKATCSRTVFYEEAKAAGNNQAAAQYALLCSHLPVTERIEMLLTVNGARDALTLAEKTKDLSLVAHVKSQLSTS